jgi:Protein of unknown function (DUF2009)
MEELAGHLSSEDYNKFHGIDTVVGKSNGVVKGTAPVVTLQQAQCIPLRLSQSERSMLRVIENALEVSEYTDAVDVSYSHTHKNKYSRIIEGLVDLLSICSGLLVRKH